MASGIQQGQQSYTFKNIPLGGTNQIEGITTKGKTERPCKTTGDSQN